VKWLAVIAALLAAMELAHVVLVRTMMTVPALQAFPAAPAVAVREAPPVATEPAPASPMASPAPAPSQIASPAAPPSPPARADKRPPPSSTHAKAQRPASARAREIADGEEDDMKLIDPGYGESPHARVEDDMRDFKPVPELLNQQEDDDEVPGRSRRATKATATVTTHRR
jgi:hypothetical protein